MAKIKPRRKRKKSCQRVVRSRLTEQQERRQQRTRLDDPTDDFPNSRWGRPIRSS